MVAQNPSSCNDNDENSSERVATWWRTCTSITVPGQNVKEESFFVMKNSGIVRKTRDSGTSDHRQHEN
jgi:hypothetical protein